MRRFTIILLCVVSNTLHVIVTGDVHGSWFPYSYSDSSRVKPSLMAVKTAVDAVRDSVGRENVLLIDAGDCLQGDNAAFYYNNVDTCCRHIFPLLASYMGYDAAVVGNHDIEAGHGVYDRVNRELSELGIPYLGGNAIKADGNPYFPEYAVFFRAGLKILVMGYTNANIKSWVSENQWRGMTFESVVSRVQESLDAVVAREKPQVVIVVAHTGTGDGDGKQLENEGLDVFNSVQGVDLMVCAHDHKPYVLNATGRSLVNSGARASYIGHSVINIETRGRKVTGKTVKSSVVRVDAAHFDRRMEEAFRDNYSAVKAFSLTPVGFLGMELRTRDAYSGMNAYVNLLHSVQLSVPEAKLSLAAPLTFNGTVREGMVRNEDMFTIYPFENQLFVVNLTGKEIVRILEFSYNGWISGTNEHVLKITDRHDPRTGAQKWSFVGRPYNFDSMAGLIYSVDVTEEYGSRIKVKSFADGSVFDPDGIYPVAMTSYRANGGGGALPQGAGLNVDDIQKRIVAIYPGIRELVREYFIRNKTVTPDLTGDASILGHWSFVPEEKVAPLMKKDLELLFGD